MRNPFANPQTEIAWQEKHDAEIAYLDARDMEHRIKIYKGRGGWFWWPIIYGLTYREVNKRKKEYAVARAKFIGMKDKRKNELE